MKMQNASKILEKLISVPLIGKRPNCELLYAHYISMGNSQLNRESYKPIYLEFI